MRNKHENHFNLYNIAINLTKNIKKWKQIQCIENIENTKKTKKCKISIFNIFSIFWWFLLNFLQYLIIFMFISQLGANILPLGMFFGVLGLYLHKFFRSSHPPYYRGVGPLDRVCLDYQNIGYSSACFNYWTESKTTIAIAKFTGERDERLLINIFELYIY